jgi:hypothetical protein
VPSALGYLVPAPNSTLKGVCQYHAPIHRNRAPTSPLCPLSTHPFCSTRCLFAPFCLPASALPIPCTIGITSLPFSCAHHSPSIVLQGQGPPSLYYAYMPAHLSCSALLWHTTYLPHRKGKKLCSTRAMHSSSSSLRRARPWHAGQQRTGPDSE